MATNTVPCRLCTAKTMMLGTKLCNSCWELENRVLSNPELARRILDPMPIGEAIKRLAKTLLEMRETQELESSGIPLGEPQDITELREVVDAF